MPSNEYPFGGFYIDFEHDMSGCDPEFSQFGAYWHVWFAMGSCTQGQIYFLFDAHDVFFIFYNRTLNFKDNNTTYLAMLEKVDMSG